MADGSATSGVPDRGLALEIDSVLAFAGLAVPAELRAGVVSQILELRRAAALVRQPRSAAAEPANVFRLQPE